MSLPRFAIRRPIAAAMTCLGVVLLGLVALPRLGLELLPSVTPHQVSVITRLRGGIAPAEVEHRVSIPLEEAFGRVSYLAGMESSSREGESTIFLRFHPEADMDLITLEIEEALSAAEARLPREADPPVVAKYAFGDRPILTYAFWADHLSLEALHEGLQRDLQPQLEKIPGVAKVEVVGGREKKILVDVDTAKLKQHGVSWADLVSTLNAANVQTTTGEVSRKATDYPLRVMGGLRTAAELQAIPISGSRGQMPLNLGEVADVREGYLKPTAYSRLNGREVAAVLVFKESHANTLDVAAALRAAMADQPLPHAIVSDHSRFIRRAIGTVAQAIGIGAVLAVATLLLFLGDLASIAVVAAAIPFSVLGTVLALFLGGGTLNVMTLAGFALGIGMLTDNTIVVLENLRRRKGDGHDEDIASAAEQVHMPLWAATATTMVAFLPLLFLHKDLQRLYGPLGLVVVGALLFSLLAALLLAPMLIKLLPEIPLRWQVPARGMERLQRGYAGLLQRCVQRPWPVLLSAAGLLGLSVMLLWNVPKDLMGVSQDRMLWARVRPPAGASLQACNTIMRGLEEHAKGLKDVDKVYVSVQQQDMRMSVHLKDGVRGPRSKYAAMDALREKGREYQDAFVYFEGGQEEESLRELDINVFYDDPLAVPYLRHRVGAALKDILLLQDLRIRVNPRQPEYHLELNRQHAAALGLSARDVSNQVHLQMRGMVPTRLFQKDAQVETVTRLNPDQTKDLEAVRGLIVDAPGTAGVPLERLMQLRLEEGPTTIWRKDRKRVMQWIGNIQDAGLEEVAGRVREALEQVDMPVGTFWEFGDAYRRFVRSNRELKNSLWMVLAFLYIVLTAFFNSFWRPLVVFGSVGMALVGVALALRLTGLMLTPAVGIGFLVLAGIVTNNAILLVDRYAMADQGGISRKALVDCSVGRFRAIAMTSATTIFGFLPMAFSTGQAAELWRPLAITLIGGLSASTLFTLFLTPILYQFGAQKRRGFLTHAKTLR